MDISDTLVRLPALTPIDGGVCLGHLGRGTHCVDILDMIYNFRIVESRRFPGYPHAFYDRGWCIAGKGTEGFHRALSRAMEWAGDPAGEPEGWIKRTHRTTDSDDFGDIQ